MKNYKKIQDIIAGAEGDFDKFYTKGNSAAGTRVRKAMQELKNLCQDVRKEVTDIKNK